MYEYRCKVIKVIDGDTVDVDIDLGFSVWLKKQRVRMMGIDTPESRTSDKEEKVYGLLAKEKLQTLLATGKESDKELAKKYSARMMYVVKVIDRDNPHEGVKFWRFNHNYKKDGILDKIMGAVKAAQHDITDPESGRDISLDIQRDPTNGIPGVKSVNNVMQTKLLRNIEECIL